MSPTVRRVDGYRFFFFSREAERPESQVSFDGGEAKIWLEPDVELAEAHGMNRSRTNTAVRLTREHRDEIRAAWREHFGR